MGASTLASCEYSRDSSFQEKRSWLVDAGTQKIQASADREHVDQKNHITAQ
jgi:hypothetical protein